MALRTTARFNRKTRGERIGKFLCTDYEGPDTWNLPEEDWFDVEERDEESAAERYVESCFDGEFDATDERKVGVKDPESGQRWIVTVEGEYCISWHARSTEVK